MRQMWTQGVTIGAAVPSGSGSWIAAALALAIAVTAVTTHLWLRGTTLAAPAAWGFWSGVTIFAVEGSLAMGSVNPLWDSLWHYAAAAGTFCPLMGVLGAKRPQDRGWQWVVLSLWVILLVPAMQAVAARSGHRLELYGAWRLLLAALIAMGLLNYLPTRFALAAILFAIGQALLLGPYLFTITTSGEGWRVAGLVLILAAAATARVISSRRVAVSSDDGKSSTTARFNARWFAFRDGWGAFWGLRVMQRVNQTAELSGWPVRLEWWDGIAPIAVGDDAAANELTLDSQSVAHIQQTLDSLLRRFERLDAAESNSGGRSSC
ncbi:MAG: hypothetical protein H0T51_02585 [Pirellulales bacterium]|nr:hypothetical protein [Pirellulales bacterium]